MENIIEVKNLTKKYKNLTAIDNLSFSVKKGEILGLLGPNGSGKSTCINCILSLLNYQEGSIKIFNQEMMPTSYDIKKEIGVVFQDIAVFEELTVYENIKYFCGLYIKDKDTLKQYVIDAIKLVGLEEFTKFYPNQLSGGLKRRLNIACGIAHKPKIIFLDEPTVAVDPQSRNHILSSIKELSKNGATIIYTTHYMEEVEIICDRVIILDKGTIIASGTIKTVKALTKIKEKVRVEITNLKSTHLKELKTNKNISEITYNDKLLIISYKNGEHNLLDLMEYLKQNNLQYNNIYQERPTLNDVFLELTGKELRD